MAACYNSGQFDQGVYNVGNILNIAQIIVAIGLIVIVILQASSSSAGSLMGGSSDSSVYHTRRGVERTLFNATIVLAVVFFVLAILNVMNTAAG
jgi:preprotein translocase subunit SecG